MDTYSLALISLLLLLAAGGLMFSHAHAWRAFQREQLDPREFDYRRRQFRRRMQTSAMLAVLAVAMFIGHLLTMWLESRTFAVVFWGAVMLVLCWVGLLATADVWATKHHFGRLRDECLVEQAKLQAELRRIQAVRGNGKKDSEHRPDLL
jgi:hypothetical protein